MGREGFASKDVATDAGAAHVASPAGTTPRDLFWVFRSRMQQRDRSGRLWNHSAHDDWGRVDSANSAAAACCVLRPISMSDSGAHGIRTFLLRISCPKHFGSATE